MNESFKVNVNKFNSSEKLLSLIRIDHSTLNNPLCIVDDNKSFFFNNQTYMPFPFSFKPVTQIEGQLPQAIVVLPSFAPQIVRWIDESMGARDATFTAMIARRSEDQEDYKVIFNVESVSLDSEKITFKLNIQNNLIKRSLRWRYDISHAKGLF